MPSQNFGNPRADEPLKVNTSVKDAGVWSKSLGISVPPEEVNHEFDAVAKELAGAVNLPGFRAGKVPRDVIEKRFGNDIKKQVAQNLIERGLRSAIVQEKLDVIGEPILDAEKPVTRGEAYNFDAGLEVRPTFTLGEYKGLKIEQEEIETLPEEIEQSVGRIQERFARMEDAPADRALGEHDVAKGTLRFLADGNEVHKEDDAQLLIMDGHVFGAHAHLGAKFLLGAKAGEKRTVEEALSSSFPVKDQVGKKATIEMEIKSIQVRNMPKADDELAKLMNVPTFEELKQKIRESLLENIREQINKRTRDELVDKIASATPFEVPPRLTEKMTQQVLAGKAQQFQRMGLDIGSIGLTAEKLQEECKKEAEREMRSFFILDAICAKENINVGDEDIDEEIVRMARAQRMRTSELYDKLVNENSLGELALQLKTRKALDFLVEQAEVSVVPRKPPVKEGGHEHPEHAPHEHSHGGQEHGHEHEHGEHGHSHG